MIYRGLGWPEWEPVNRSEMPSFQPGNRREAISTAVAIRNLEEEELVVTCQLMQEGAVLEEVDIELKVNGQDGPLH